RYRNVTGVQTCALPISRLAGISHHLKQLGVVDGTAVHKRQDRTLAQCTDLFVRRYIGQVGRGRALNHQAERRLDGKSGRRRAARSEERRVGKERSCTYT